MAEQLTALKLNIEENSQNATEQLDKLIGRLSALRGELAKGFSSKAFVKEIRKVARVAKAAADNINGTKENVETVTGGTINVPSNVDPVTNGDNKPIPGNSADGAKPIKEKAKETGKLNKKLGELFTSLKRIAVYRALRTALKEITQGLKEGVDNLYKWSVLGNGNFASSMDSIASSLLYMKNSLGAMLAPLINALAPVLEYVADLFVRLVNYVNQFFAALSGADTWTKALRTATKYQAKLNSQLMKFDELNVINGDDSTNYIDAFEEVELAETNITKKLNEIGDKLSTIYEDNIKPILEACGDIIKDIAIIAEPIAMAISIVGLDILESALETIKEDVRLISNTFSTLKTVIGKIKDIFDGWNIDIEEVFDYTALGAIKDAFDFIKNTLNVINNILDKINGKNISWADVFGIENVSAKSVITSVKEYLGGASTFANLANGNIAGAIGSVIGTKVGIARTNILSNIWESVKSAFQNVFGFANGGYPTSGSLFLAGEVPGATEMVGNINGRTGVASGSEITGIREAVLESGENEAGLLGQLVQIGSALLKKNNGLGSPNASAGRWIQQSLNAYGRVTG